MKTFEFAALPRYFGNGSADMFFPPIPGQIDLSFAIHETLLPFLRKAVVAVGAARAFFIEGAVLILLGNGHAAGVALVVRK